MADTIKIDFNVKNWKIKVVERSRGRMKFQIKLNAEEADAFRNFTNSVKPKEISLDDFIRSIFFRGIQSLEKQITEDLVKHMEENRQDFEASGFTFDTSGNLTGVDESQASGAVEIVE